MTRAPDSPRSAPPVPVTGLAAGVIGIVVVCGAMLAAVLALTLSVAGHAVAVLSAAAAWTLRQAGIAPVPRTIPVRVRRSPYWSDDTGR